MLAEVLAAAALVVPGAQAQQELSVRPYAGGLSALTGISSTPAEPRRLYAVEQVGRIRYFVNGKLGGTFLDIRDRIVAAAESRVCCRWRSIPNYCAQPSLLRQLHRQAAATRASSSSALATDVASSRPRASCCSSASRLPNHNGGELQFDSSGRLYVGMGDGGSAGDPGNRAQNMNQRLGKLLRIDPLRRGARWQIVGLGLRNPWRFSFDRANGDLYIGDVGTGQLGRDRLPAACPDLDPRELRLDGFEGPDALFGHRARTGPSSSRRFTLQP